MYPLSELDPLEPCKIKKKEFRGFEKMFWIFFLRSHFLKKTCQSGGENKCNFVDEICKLGHSLRMQDGGENATQYLNNLWKFIHVQEGWEGSGGSAIKSNFENRTENQLNICLVMHGASKKRCFWNDLNFNLFRGTNCCLQEGGHFPKHPEFNINIFEF